MKQLLLILILPFAACQSCRNFQSHKDSEFPKLTESEKQAFNILNQ